MTQEKPKKIFVEHEYRKLLDLETEMEHLWDFRMEIDILKRREVAEGKTTPLQQINSHHLTEDDMKTYRQFQKGQLDPVKFREGEYCKEAKMRGSASRRLFVEFLARQFGNFESFAG